MGKHSKPESDSDAIRIADARLAERHERAHEDLDFQARAKALDLAYKTPGSKSVDSVLGRAEEVYAFLSGASDRAKQANRMIRDFADALGMEVVTGETLAAEAEEHIQHATSSTKLAEPANDVPRIAILRDGVMALLESVVLPDDIQVTIGQVKEHVLNFARRNGVDL